ncbi:restriction endonuclease subunit S [Vibrio parahaemolyticus]|uniref:restriction endonuclease subunit S n=1 Tax=Vibrio parahaemolyticus TaxID=670 RepID=UPI0010E4C59E|nr:restriction endonuclease subunit S [Vibrio parahaemolyticus]EJG1691991.1 restriction endonuclease subunit S [Vibrio parahaemolyticus]MBE3735929.1 restriction endonuclease subunit S [Vibrio parahaemolyticus]MDF5342240.1 restriction endonuclease subunit S [Vibrio parahaemolyticus]TBT92704.1 restriction endonuclease subunit S [Vibrio parahaemolyticus]HCH4280964.1 restriction endonuclease subunit S [Vibrio parahaemolyticus]
MAVDQSPMNKLITEHIDIWTSAVKTRSTSGRGSSKKLELYGVKKLRELILELAVRGKLVPQDPNDEPASVLLERIAAEKAQLVKEKKIKKPKALPPINDSKPFQIPNNWGWSQLGFLTNYGVCDKLEPKDASPSTWVLELEDVEKYTSRLLKKVRFEERVFKSTKNSFQKNDVIYGKLRPYLDKVLVADEDGACTTEMIPIRGYIGLIPEFIRLVLKTPYFIEYANTSTHGMNLPRMGTDKARAALFPLAPLNEQHRIVAKVDELMVLCDQLEQQTEASIEAHQVLVTTLLDTLTNSADADELMQNWARISEHFDTLFTTEESIDQLKQTILQLAVMGKLVPQDPSDEPAAELLKRIAEEKAQLVKEKKIKKQKALPLIAEDEKLFELPSGWEWCRLGDLELSSEAGWSPKCLDTPRSEDSWGVLKVSAVTWNQYNPMENKELPNSLAPREHLEVQDGDFLISRANTADLVAKAVIVPNDSPTHLMMSDKIIRFRFSDKVSSHYINLFNNSQFARNYYSQVAGGTSSSMKNVSREQIKNLLICLPPVATQTAIIDIVGCFFDICEQLKQKVQENQITQFQLTDAIVEQAV